MSLILKRGSEKMSKADDFLMELFRSAVSAVQPQKLIEQTVRVNNRHLVVRNKTYELRKPVRVVGFGKAVHGMAITLDGVLGPLLQRGIVSIPEGSLRSLQIDTANSRIEFLEGALNNLPDENSLKAALKIKDFVQNLDENDTVMVLISGGGSALLPLPKGKITLSEKLDLVRKLGQKGADIFEMNCVRKEISQLKGGGLAVQCFPARVITLILSDVLGDPLDIIASGPTCPNTDGPEKAMDILKKYSLYEELPASIKETLNSNLDPDEDNEFRKKIFVKVDNFIIGNNRIATQAIVNRTKGLKLQCFTLSTNVSGDVEEISDFYVKIATIFQAFRTNKKTNDEVIDYLISIQSNLVLYENAWEEQIKNLDSNRDIIVVLAGEPTVFVTGKGIGGRNQQLALSFALKLSQMENAEFYKEIQFMSCGTDGIDGPTNAAGAIGFCNMVAEAKEENLNAEEYLKDNDCYNFFKHFSGGKYLIKTGHTGTNVMDVHLMSFRKRYATK
ncbi:glycerate kinase [Harmonia axyridis]|uniref:glycerate kinase n=1 Tax=Harmonia axyridis TaxID=115357 RepID=UPI001E2768E0|nr:glycerate kinase [Harmonia axyridis]